MLAPIALFCYQRLDILQQTVDALKENELASQSDLIIFSDGYKNEEDKQNVKDVRNYIKTISGFNSIKIYEAPTNKGLAASIISGVTQVVNKYGKIIVVEDDILTSKYFLKYMNEALNVYENDDNVGSIAGYGFEIANMPETYFLKRFDCWGWATWKRGWELFEPDGTKLLNYILDNKLQTDFNNENSTSYVQMLEDQIQGRNNSWAIKMYASFYKNNKLQLHPGVSLCRNIGFGALGTHCLHEDDRLNVKIASEPIPIKKITIEQTPYAYSKCVEYFNWLYAPQPYVKGNWLVKKIKNGKQRTIVFCNLIKISYKKKEKIYNSMNIPIFLASDDNYAPYLCTTIYSVLENTKSYIKFFILDGGITQESKNLISKSLKNFCNFDIEYIDMKQFELERFPNIKHYSLNSFSRYFIPELKTNLKKSLYLDVDIIVKKDIKNIYLQELNDFPLGAIPEDFYMENEKYLKENIYPAWSGKKPYFNAGALLLDVQKFRENCYSNILVNKTTELAQKLSCADQDVFNIVFENNYKILDYKFNYMPDFQKLYKRKLGKIAKKLPAQSHIIHYTSYKPWKSRECACKDFFWKVMKKTQFFNKTHKSYLALNPTTPFIEHIFSIKNEPKGKIIRILGFKITRRKKSKNQNK